MKRDTRSAFRSRAKATESMVDNAMAEVAAARKAEWDAAKSRAAERDANREHFTAEQLADARLIQDDHGWHRVVRVNSKSVTVETAYSWTDRIPVKNVRGMRT